MLLILENEIAAECWEPIGVGEAEDPAGAADVVAQLATELLPGRFRYMAVDRAHIRLALSGVRHHGRHGRDPDLMAGDFSTKELLVLHELELPAQAPLSDKSLEAISRRINLGES